MLKLRAWPSQLRLNPQKSLTYAAVKAKLGGSLTASFLVSGTGCRNADLVGNLTKRGM